MTILEDVLLEEYVRNLRIEQLLKDEIDSLPKGSLQKKQINGKEYFYLQYRSGDTVKSKYIKTSDCESITNQLEKRKSDIRALKEIQKTKGQIEKALGKDFINEHTAEGIY